MTRNGQAANVAAAHDADWTIREIEQQPGVWTDAIAEVAARRAEIDAWLAPSLARPDLRIILTGAGSSAYIGEALAPYLTAKLQRPVEAISTTAIVGNPRDYLLPDRPTLLISFARSGNSPESAAAVEIADAVVPECRHLFVCCNPASALYRMSEQSADKFALLMPRVALDNSFAMTSSFTAMLVSVLAMFAPDPAQTEAAIAAARTLLAAPRAGIHALADAGFERMVFLGSGSLHGIATEAALKVLELSAGRTISYAESPLGFRHGPKFVIDDGTLVALMRNPDAYSRRYDADLLDEIERDGAARRIVDVAQEAGIDTAALDQGWAGPVYLIWCQLLAYANALRLGVSPDNPSPSGEVNRVVQGVTIHPFAPTGG